MPKVVPETGVAKYFPDSPPIPYTPMGVSPNPWQYIRVFLPDYATVGPAPSGGRRAIALTGFGGFASTPAPTALLGEQASWSALGFEAMERGWVVFGFGLTGADTEDYAPGGSKHDGEYSIPVPVLGRGTYDQPSSTAQGLNHHDDVGDSLDGGLSYPFQDWPSCFKDTQLAVQKMREIAETYGVDPDLLFMAGRSAGGIAAAHALIGPDRADPEMLDHRSLSTRVAGGVLWSQIGWMPAYDPTANLSSGAARLYPQLSNPESLVCESIQQAPPIWPRESSWLRFGTRDYAGLGPDISGDELRALNGQTPLIMVNTDEDPALGLKSGISPTEACAYVGTDATNGRIPALSDFIKSSVAHPAIMGPLAMARLREIQVGDFHEQNSALVLRQASVDALSGHTAPDGTPLADLVTTTWEEHETENGGLARHVMALLEVQAERIGGPLPVPDPPKLHPRTIFRKAVVAILTDKVTLSGVTLPVVEAEYRRARPSSALIRVYTKRDEPEIETESPRVYKRSLGIQIEVLVPRLDGLVDALDEATAQVEQLLDSDECLSLLGDFGVTRLEADGVNEDAYLEGDRLWGGHVISYDIVYHDAVPRDPVDLGPLQKLGIDIQHDPNSEEPSSQDVVHLPVE